MSVIDVQKLKDFDKACTFSSYLFTDTLKLLSNIIGGYKSLDDLNKPLNRADFCKGPQSPRLKIKHSKIAEILLDLYMKNSLISPDDKNGIVCFPPVIQSGGRYTPDLHCNSDDHYFEDNVIVVHLSLKYKEYCSSIIRTFVITPHNNIELKQTYRLLLRVQKYIISVLTDGVCLGDVYHQGIQFLEKENPVMIKYLIRKFGSKIENEREDEHFCIVPESTAIAKKNMTFNVSIGFCNIYDESLMDKPPHTYSLWVGDCVLVKKGRGAHIMKYTTNAPKLFIINQARQIIDL